MANQLLLRNGPRKLLNSAI